MRRRFSFLDRVILVTIVMLCALLITYAVSASETLNRVDDGDEVTGWEVRCTGPKIEDCYEQDSRALSWNELEERIGDPVEYMLTFSGIENDEGFIPMDASYLNVMRQRLEAGMFRGVVGITNTGVEDSTILSPCDDPIACWVGVSRMCEHFGYAGSFESRHVYIHALPGAPRKLDSCRGTCRNADGSFSNFGVIFKCNGWRRAPMPPPVPGGL